MPLSVDPKLRTLSVLLRQGGPRAVRAAREQMKKEADKIVKLAKDNAPILHHDVIAGGAGTAAEVHAAGFSGSPGPLERSIKREDTYEDNRRLQINVVAGEGLGAYPLMMEEGLAPYGSGAFKLGPLSREKRLAGKDVGGKFMERALGARQDAMPDEILTAIITELEDEG